jgi:hypothetical protein
MLTFYVIFYNTIIIFSAIIIIYIKYKVQNMISKDIIYKLYIH